MQWSKIKNIIILLLLVVNAILLAQVVLKESESARFRRESLEEAAALLGRSGIRVEVDALPDDPALGPMRCARDSESEAALAAALLGGAEVQSDGSYAGTRGEAWFYSSGDFNAVLAAGAYPLEGRTAEGVAREVMKRLDFEGEILSVTEEGTATVVRMRQSWEGTPIFSCEATLTFEDGALQTIRGRRLPGTPVAAAGDGAMTVATVLVRFLRAVTEDGYVRSEVRGLTAGYEMEAVPTSSTFRLQPVWLIETDASTLRVAADGTLSQISE